MSRKTGALPGVRPGTLSPGQWARRDVLKLGTAAGLGGALPQGRWAGSLRNVQVLQALHAAEERGGGSRLDPAIVIDGTDVHVLAMRALDAATAAGATYADVRLTRTLEQGVGTVALERGSDSGFFNEDDVRGVGVRVRVGNAWGFAACPYWDLDEVVALAREAAAEAKANTRGSSQTTEWAPVPVARGHWATPIQVDPFVLPVEEKIDWLQAGNALAARYRRGSGGNWGTAAFTREERAVATTEGAYFTQTLYTSGGGFTFRRQPVTKNGGGDNTASARGLERCAAGWELFQDADVPGQLPRLWEEADPRHRPPPLKRGEIGRYDVVFDARSMGTLLEKTLGVATQLDRALGYEANAGSILFLGADPLDTPNAEPAQAATSYLGPDPLALLGRVQVASPLVTVTATRSLPRGVATVKWDDEGVESDAFPLVRDGILVDYQTTRDLAPALAPWYQQQGKPVRSHGCAGAQDATAVTLQHMPNLVLESGKEAGVSFEELVADTKRGLAVLEIAVRTDSQARTGEGYEPDGTHTHVREIINGKLGAAVEGLSFLFNSTNLWKHVVALGGATSAVQYASRNRKGEPAQIAPYSVRAVPAKVTDVDFIDPTRKA